MAQICTDKTSTVMKHNAALLVVFTLLVFGCGPSGPKTYPVRGTVTCQGKPLPFGTLMLVPTAGGPVTTARIDAGGGYQLEAVPGKHAVAVVGALPPEQGGPDPDAGEYDLSPPVAEARSPIAAKYNHHHTSGITVVVEAKDDNQLNIHLE